MKKIRQKTKKHQKRIEKAGVKERELDNVVDMFSPDMALAIAVDPNTGEILGMSSRPNYDPNNYKNYSMEELSRNLPIWASYEPGSTFKNVNTI